MRIFLIGICLGTSLMATRAWAADKEEDSAVQAIEKIGGRVARDEKAAGQPVIGVRLRDKGRALRSHWTIENNLHWQMDVSFAEDASRIQKRNGGQNFALLRRLALGLLKRHPSKESIKSKRYEAALDVAFLEEVLK